MKKRLPLAASLAGIALAASACSPGPAAPAAAVPAAPTQPASAAATGWEMDPEGGAGRIKAAGLDVLTAEGAAEHFHAHLDVFVDGRAVAVPAHIGIALDPSQKPVGISALHSHDPSGIIHVEAPAVGDTFTLAQFLTEWGVLDGTDKTPGAAHSGADDWTVIVNGTKQPGTVSDVVLKAHDEVVLFHGPAPDPLPTSFAFPAGL